MGPQAQVTRIVSIPLEYIERVQDSRRQASPQAYPGGQDPMNLHYTKNELLIGFNDEVNATKGMQETAIPSLNGIEIPTGKTARDIMNKMHFVGVNKTDFNPNSPEAPQSGLAVISQGTIDPPYTALEVTFPGDKICWYIPELDEQKKLGIPQRRGKPQNKINVYMKRLDFREVKFQENALVNLASMKTGKGGILDADGFSPIDGDFRIDEISQRDAAMLIRDETLQRAMAIIHILVTKGVLQVNTPGLIAEHRNAINNNAAAALDLNAYKKASNLQDFLDLSKQDENDSKKIKPLDHLHASSTSGADAAARAKNATEMKQANEASLFWLASTLGLVTNGAVPINDELRKDVILAAYNHVMGFTKSVKSLYALPALMDANRQDANNHNKLREYRDSLVGIDVTSRAILAQCTHQVTRTVIGTTYSHNIPGPDIFCDLNIGEK